MVEGYRKLKEQAQQREEWRRHLNLPSRQRTRIRKNVSMHTMVSTIY